MKTNLEIIKKAYTNFSQGNIPAILDVLSDNIEWELPKSAHVDFSRVFTGKEQVLNLT